MTRKEFRRLLRKELPSAQCSTADGLGTALGHPYIDVFLPTRDVPILAAICKREGVRNCGGVAVVPYYGSFRRISLEGKPA